jgi:hypothetical protein
MFHGIVLTGILETGLFWVIKTIRKDRKDKRYRNDTNVSI